MPKGTVRQHRARRPPLRKGRRPFLVTLVAPRRAASGRRQWALREAPPATGARAPTETASTAYGFE